MASRATPMPDPAPVVLVDEIKVCDAYPEHEIRILTDGHRCYAYDIARGGSDAGDASRTGTVLTIPCDQPGRDDEPCTGQVTLDLTAVLWDEATDERLRLFSCASDVEVDA